MKRIFSLLLSLYSLSALGQCVQSWTCPLPATYSFCKVATNLYNIQTPTFTTSGVCPVSQSSYSLDGATPVVYGGTSIPLTLLPGQHTIIFRIYNPISNTDIYSPCTVTVYIFPQEIATINGLEICNGGQAQVSIPPLPPGYSVVWEYRDGTTGLWSGPTSIAGSPANTNPISVACPPAPTTGPPTSSFVTRYFRPIITGTPTWLATCIQPTSIKVWCPTVAGNITGHQNFCLPLNSPTLTLNYNGGNYNQITWAGPGVVNSGTQQQLVTIPTTAGTYTYTATVRNGTCAWVPVSVTITIENPLSTLISCSETDVCPNDDAILTMLTCPQPAGTLIYWEYQINCTGPWLPSPGTGVSSCTQNTNNIGDLGPYPIPPTTSICWRVVLSSGTGICPDFTSNTKQINIIQPPCCPTITASGPNPKCPGAAITLSAQLPAGCNTTGLILKWYFNGVYIATGTTLTATAPGNYTVVASNQCGSCSSLPFEVKDCKNTLTVEGPCSKSKSEPPLTLCANVTSSGTPCSGTPVYTWTGQGIVGTNIGPCITVSPTQTTIYTVTVTGMGCTPPPLTATWTVKVCK